MGGPIMPHATAQTRERDARPLVMVVGARGIPDVEGGAEKNAEMLFPRLVQAGYRVVLLGLSDNIRSSEYRGVELLPAPNRRVLNTDKLFYYLHAIGVARRLRPDIVHLQGLGASLFLWAYKMLGARVVVRYGSADYTVDKWGFLGRQGFRAAEAQARFADAIIAVAPSLAKRLADKGITHNVHIISNAVDVPPQLPEIVPDTAAGRAPFILAVGRITAQKNVDGMIKGFRRFKAATGKPHKLLLAGGLEDEPYVRSIKAMIDGDPNIVLLGRCARDRLEQLYAGCAVYINGSLHEGMSNAVLEAVSRRCPTILSDIPENLDFGLAPHFYFAPNDADGIGRHMAAAIDDPDRFRADRGSFMDWDMVAQRTGDVYRAILA
jgi:glycosyltransferase involved in cell wall biosynthesis